MEDLTFRLSLTFAGEPDKEGLRSMRVTFKSYIIDAFKLDKNDVVFLKVLGVYENKKAKDYKPQEFDVFGKVSKIGGKKSYGLTIEKDEVRRQKLDKKNELAVNIRVISRGSENP